MHVKVLRRHKIAKGFKSGGRDFKPGQSGNPKGGPGLPQHVRDARKLTATIFAQLGTDLIYATAEDLQKVLDDDSKSMIEKIVARILLTSLVESDQARVGFMLDRILGKPKLNEDQPQVKPVIITTRDGTKIECGMQEKKEGE